MEKYTSYNREMLTTLLSLWFGFCWLFFFLIEDQVVWNNCSVTEALSHGEHLLFSFQLIK